MSTLYIYRDMICNISMVLQMNYVFDGIIDRYSLDDRWILLLEEDHYMSPDALHVLNHIIERRNTFVLFHI